MMQGPGLGPGLNANHRKWMNEWKGGISDDDQRSMDVHLPSAVPFTPFPQLMLRTGPEDRHIPRDDGMSRLLESNSEYLLWRHKHLSLTFDAHCKSLIHDWKYTKHTLFGGSGGDVCMVVDAIAPERLLLWVRGARGLARATRRWQSLSSHSSHRSSFKQSLIQSPPSQPHLMVWKGSDLPPILKISLSWLSLIPIAKGEGRLFSAHGCWSI